MHVNEPGRTEWEGFATATRAAAAGGVTTIIDMPLNSIPPTVDVAALEVKRKKRRGPVFRRRGLLGRRGPGQPRGAARAARRRRVRLQVLPAALGRGRVPPLHRSDLDALRRRSLRRLDGLLLVHAEDSAAIDRAPALPGGGATWTSWASRPRAAENVAIAQVIEAAWRTGARAHILHLSSSDALPMLAGRRREGVRVTAETCPHYLHVHRRGDPRRRHPVQVLPADPRGGQPRGCWAGAGRRHDRLRRLRPLACTPELKRLDVGDFVAAWGGISSLELGLPVVWTEARRAASR